MHLPAILLCALWSAVVAETSDDYELMYVNLDNEIDNGLHPTEDRKFIFNSLSVSKLHNSLFGGGGAINIINIDSQ